MVRLSAHWLKQPRLCIISGLEVIGTMGACLADIGLLILVPYCIPAYLNLFSSSWQVHDLTPDP